MCFQRDAKSNFTITAEELLRHNKNGQDLFETFVEERIFGESLWVKIKKRSLLAFKSQSESIKTKIVQLKEEKDIGYKVSHSSKEMTRNRLEQMFREI